MQLNIKATLKLRSNDDLGLFPPSSARQWSSPQPMLCWDDVLKRPWGGATKEEIICGVAQQGRGSVDCDLDDLRFLPPAPGPNTAQLSLIHSASPPTTFWSSHSTTRPLSGAPDQHPHNNLHFLLLQLLELTSWNRKCHKIKEIGWN